MKLSAPQTRFAPTTTAHINPVVLQLAQGLTDRNRFYDCDRSILFRGSIVDRSNPSQSAVDTYHAMVSLRARSGAPVLCP